VTIVSPLRAQRIARERPRGLFGPGRLGSMLSEGRALGRDAWRGGGVVVTALVHPTPSSGHACDVVEEIDGTGHGADVVENGHSEPHSVPACHLVASKHRISDGQL